MYLYNTPEGIHLKILKIVSACLKQLFRDRANLTISIFTTPIFIVFTKFAISEHSTSMGYSFTKLVPGLIIFSVIMIILPAAMSIANELESGTMMHFQIAKISPLIILFSFSLVHLLLSFVSLSLSLIFAIYLGFEFKNNLPSIYLLSILGYHCCIHIGILLGCFSKNTNRAFLFSSFAMFLLLLFSGILFPKPNVVFIILNIKINLFDIFPTTSLNAGFNKLLLENQSINEILYEIIITILSSFFLFVASIYTFLKYSKKVN
jgi:ABC-type multidrug transport system permease subunit